jgi:hypothetical protein
MLQLVEAASAPVQVLRYESETPEPGALMVA